MTDACLHPRSEYSHASDYAPVNTFIHRRSKYESLLLLIKMSFWLSDCTCRQGRLSMVEQVPLTGGSSALFFGGGEQCPFPSLPPSSFLPLFFSLPFPLLLRSGPLNPARRSWRALYKLPQWSRDGTGRDFRDPTRPVTCRFDRFIHS